MFRKPPASDFDHLHEHIERIWERLIQGPLDVGGYGRATIEPPADVLLTDGHVVVRIEVAGLSGGELDVEVIGAQLIVRGMKRQPARPGDARFAQMEISGGAFERRLMLPCQVDVEASAVEYANGYLEIRLPRLHRIEDRHIRVPVRRM